MLRESLRLALAVVSVLFCTQIAMCQTAAPTITLRAPTTLASQTRQTFIDLQGSATSPSEIKNVVWVNQLGNRGRGSWTVGANSTSWQVTNVPLKPGSNQITVTIVDSNGRSASLHVAILRIVSGTEPPVEVRSGTWNGKPVTLSGSQRRGRCRRRHYSWSGSGDGQRFGWLITSDIATGGLRPERSGNSACRWPGDRLHVERVMALSEWRLHHPVHHYGHQRKFDQRS